MKKLLSVLLFVFVVLSCVLFVAFADSSVTDNDQAVEAEETTLPVVKYYYISESGETIMTDKADEFEKNAASQKVEVIFQLGYEIPNCDCRASINKDSTHEEVEDFKIAHRNEMKEIHTAENKAFLDNSGFTDFSTQYTVVMSAYSPFVAISFDKYDVYKEYSKQILDLAASSQVLSLSIEVPIETTSSAIREDENAVGNYYLSTAISDISASDQTYDGTGVKVGIIEADGVAYSTSHSELSGLSIIINGTTNNSHTVNVTRILCGSYGVARGVDEVYIYQTSRNSLNLISAREAASNCILFEFSDDAPGQIRIEELLRYMQGDSIKAAAFWFTNSLTRTSNDQVVIDNHTDYDLRFADVNGEFLAASTSATNIEIKSYNNIPENTILLQIQQYLSRTTSYTDYGAFTWVYK